MISKRILISMIVIISLAEFITCPSATKPDPAASKTGVKPRVIPASKSGVGKPGATATKPTDSGMDPDNSEMESEKPNGLRQKFFRPIRFIFWPVRFLWGKFKNLKNKLQQNNNMETEFDVEKPIDKNRKKV
ncbi:uncharacterized protein LOC113549446 [Rhopalosiphum maidis]|uniref:uncharacterized protein LOC113549446 n=1 Tax=Rhopalosiphum maidis TaxID=43146 RepID=UPI000EFDC98C|nr:uncharacterized protein LOC113549446 [Rhopalosiphum maidis]